MAPLNAELLEILVCPKCRGELREDESELTCTTCEFAFPIRDGIPVMLVDEARPLG
ncbi:MAG TPA: Trm112 family protein [Vulgatibacter sp.]|nr:Trm112 family protein [Vulgatibacter sp.]